MTNSSVIIKVGTAVLTNDDNELDLGIISLIVDELAALKRSGSSVILVSSGAVGAGRPLITLPSNTPETLSRQVFSAAGQVGLINSYAKELQRHSLLPAQILVTKNDFGDRQHYLNMRNSIQAAAAHPNLIPIVNENDVVATSELMFTDNDELASLIAAMMGSDKLVILTAAPGLMSGDPSLSDSSLISEVDPSTTPLESFNLGKVSAGGRGGMATKCRFAYKLSGLGITTHVIDGKQPENISKIFAGKSVGTTFKPQRRKSTTKRWLAYADNDLNSYVTIDDGAKSALLDSTKANSLLLVGVSEAEGVFERGDTIYIRDQSDQVLGWGKSSLSADHTRKLHSSGDTKRVLIHYDYMHISSLA